MNQDKYFRLENINRPKIIVKSILDYDVVQKISLVLHVQVRWSFIIKQHAGSSFSSAADLWNVPHVLRTRSTARPPTTPSSRPWPPSRCTWRTLTTGRRGFSRVWGPTWGWPNCAWAPATEGESTSLRRRWVIVHLTASVQTHAGQCWSTRTSFPPHLLF